VSLVLYYEFGEAVISGDIIGEIIGDTSGLAVGIMVISGLISGMGIMGEGDAIMLGECLGEGVIIPLHPQKTLNAIIIIKTTLKILFLVILITVAFVY